MMSELIWFDVREPVSLFVGREDQLRQIAEHIRQRRVVLGGLGGVGKTELAVKYAREHFNAGNSVVWINAGTTETIKDSFRRLLKELNLKTKDNDGEEKSIQLMAKGVHSYFYGNMPLFIFDNADKYSVINDVIPPNTSGHHILITSQNRDLLKEQEHEKIELGTLCEDEAMAFIKEALKIDDTLQDIEIRELAEMFGYLPLALQHVVAYVREADYIERVGSCVKIFKNSEQEMKAILKRSGLHGYENSIFLTFHNKIGSIKQEDIGEFATEILNIMAYFSSNTISKETFLKLAEEKMEESTVKNERANVMLARAFNLLGQHYLVIVKKEHVSIHRLVQQVIRIVLGKRNEGKSLEEHILKKSLQLFQSRIIKKGECTEIDKPHLRSVWNYATMYEKLMNDFNEMSEHLSLTTNHSQRDRNKNTSRMSTSANFNAKTYERETPLECNGKNETFSPVIDKDSETSTKTSTLFHVPTENYVTMSETVKNENAIAPVENKGKLTPLDIAKRYGYAEIMNVLQNKRAGNSDKSVDEASPPHRHEETGVGMLSDLEIEPSACKGNHLNSTIAANDKKIAFNVKPAARKRVSDSTNASDHVNHHQEGKDKTITLKDQLKFNRRSGTAGMSGQYYEIKLAMFYLLRGLTEHRKGKIERFYLATNMEEIGDFDDVVFKYDYKDQCGIEKSRIIFLQAKHRETLKKEISLSTMLADTGKGDFLLKKYFDSYQDIRRRFIDKKEPNDKILGTDFKDCYFIIFTNTLFSYGQSEANNIKVLVEDDCILCPNNNNNFYYQLILGGNKHSKIIDSLQCSSECKKLAKELAECTLSKKLADKNKPIIEKYYNAITEIIIEQKNANEGAFRKSFLQSDNVLSTTGKKLREAFLHEINKAKIYETNTIEEVISKLMKVTIKLPANLAENKKPGETAQALPSDVVDEDEIREFLSKLKLFVRQPNEEQLGNNIKQNMLSNYSIESEDANIIFSDVQNKVMKWWKQGGSSLQFLTERDDFFLHAKGNLSKLQLLGLAALNTRRIEKLGLRFESDQIRPLKRLIRTKRILIIKTRGDALLLSSVKVHQALEEIPEYTLEKGEYRYISMTLSSVLNLQTKVVDAFKSEKSNLLLIECDDTDKNVDKLYQELSEVMLFNASKKIILVTHDSDPLTGKFKDTLLEVDTFDEKRNYLSHLANESQKIILEGKRVNFQGKQVRLDTIINDKLRYLIDGRVLSTLINNELIEIAKAHERLGELKHSYIDRILNSRVNITSDCLKDKTLPDFFVISNISDNELSSYVSGEKICKFRDYKENLSNPARFVTLQDSDYMQENLKQLYKDCEQYNRPIHWLEKEGDKFIWRETQGALSNLRKFIDTNSVNEYEVNKLTDIRERVAILSGEPGMGKTTILTKLVKNSIKADPTLWVVRINLIEQTNNLNKINICENLNQATEYLSNMLNLKTILEQEVLKHRIKQQGNIAVVFDGFDEICPTYKDKVIALLNTLKDSKVEKLWVTTRPCSKDELEDKLSVLSYTMKPLCIDDQKLFFKKFWNNKLNLHLSLSDNNFNVYVENLQNVLLNSIANKDAKLTGLPLQVRMLAEAFQENFKEFYHAGKNEPKLPNKLRVHNLYQWLFDSKNIIFKEEKKKHSPTDFSVEEDSIIRYLIKKEANINFVNTIGATIALSAVLNNNGEILKFSLRNGAKVNTNQGIFGDLHITVLHLAALFNAVDTVTFLIQEKYVDVNSGKGVSLTPLHCAALSESLETTEYLIEHGADVHANVNISNMLTVLREKKNEYFDENVLVANLIDFFCFGGYGLGSGLTEFIGLTPNVLSEICGHKNRLLAEKSDQSKPKKFRNSILKRIKELAYDELIMLKEFIALRKAGDFSLSQLYIARTVEGK